MSITKSFKVINSRPSIEQVYLEDKRLLKDVIKGYYNQNSIDQISSFRELTESELLTDDCKNRDIIKQILRKNKIAMNKKIFSEKFFASAFKRDAPLSISSRLSNLVP